MRKSTLKRLKENRQNRQSIDRWKIERWYPRPSDLQLPDVAEHARAGVRTHLAPVLRLFAKTDFGVKAGDCWRVARDFTTTAMKAGERIGYVEGVWTRARENHLYQGDDDNPVPHAWNIFEGWTIDLMAEFYAWSTFGDDSPWLHEPLREYNKELDDYEDWSVISSDLWLNEGHALPPDIQAGFEADDPDVVSASFGFVNDIVFKPARDRLLAREAYLREHASAKVE